MADPLEVPDPPSGMDGIEVTTKLCPECGVGYTGDSHKDCTPKTWDGSLKKPPPSSSKSHLDDLPAEALPFSKDPGRQLNQYILVRQIGRGGMGTVWKGWDRKLTRWVAIKFLNASEDEDIARFQREAKLAARLRHPNIAPIYEVGEAPASVVGEMARHYLAMEYIDGSTLAAAPPLPLREMLDLFMKVAQGIEAAHKAGVVHRDIKPQNLMLTRDKWPYVMDFGLAKVIQAESSLSVSGSIMGTPAYMAPEQAQGQLDQIDGQSDVYSLGATMYTIFCKQQPFMGHTPMEILMKVCNTEAPPPRSVNPDLPVEVEKILQKAMAKEKADRYASAAALAEDIKRHLSNEEIEARGPSSLKLAAKKVRRNFRSLLVTALLLATGGTIMFLKRTRITIPDPIVTSTPLIAEKALEWSRAWRDLRDLINCDDWKPGDAALAGRVNSHLASMAVDAPLHEGNIQDWITDQAEKAEVRVQQIRGTLDEKRTAASRIVAWCDTIAAAAKGVESLKKSLGAVPKTRAAAVMIADAKGRFALKIVVGPFAEVTRLARDGKDIPLAQRTTPLVIGDLEIGDFEVELSHPRFGKKKERFPASRFIDGKTYLLSGRMEAAGLRVTELP